MLLKMIKGNYGATQNSYKLERTYSISSVSESYPNRTDTVVQFIRHVRPGRVALRVTGCRIVMYVQTAIDCFSA